MHKRLFIAIALILTMFTVTACSGGEDEPTNFNGSWSSADTLGATFKATIESDTIKVNLKTRDSEGLYWAGTFSSVLDENKQIKSVGDKGLLEKSVFGSLDESKAFTYNKGDLVFKFTMLGTGTEVRLKKDN